MSELEHVECGQRLRLCSCFSKNFFFSFPPPSHSPLLLLSPSSFPKLLLYKQSTSVRQVCAFDLCLLVVSFPPGLQPGPFLPLGIVQPTHRKGNHSQPSNYSPVALASSISKFVVFLLRFHFLKHLESHSHIASD